MSRSILKSSGPNKKIPIQVIEGQDTDYDTLTRVKPWGPVDEDPLVMNDVQHEMERLQRNAQKMHQKMMANFPHGGGHFVHPPFEPLGHPPVPRPPALPAPFLGPTALNHELMPAPVHLPTPHNGNTGQVACLPEPTSPCGSLTRNKRGVVAEHDHNAAVIRPINFGVGPMMLPPPPPMPPMPLVPAGPTPVVKQDECGFKTMELILDVKGFLPEDIHINTEGKVLHIHACRLSAKHDVSGQGGVHQARMAKECRRQYMLPEVVRAENLCCFVNRHGQLTIEGPLGPDIMRTSTKKKVKFAAGNK